MPNRTARMHSPKQMLAVAMAAGLGLLLARLDAFTATTTVRLVLRARMPRANSAGSPAPRRMPTTRTCHRALESGDEDVHGESPQAAILMGAGVSDGARLPSQSALTFTGVIGVRRDR